MLAITLGDPLSVNIEILSKLTTSLPSDLPVVLLGSYGQWKRQAPESLHEIYKVGEWGQIKPGLNFFDVSPRIGPVCPTQLSKMERGEASVNALHALRKHPDLSGSAILTSPIDKSVCSQAGFAFPGQTEYFQDLAASEGVMILAGPKLKVGLVTNHLPLSDVSASISQPLIESKCRLFFQSLQEVFGLDNPKIAIVGINPHCGDNGMFGDEDEKKVEPAVNSLIQGLPGLIGPIPADTAFFRAYSGEFDGVLAMYHDQGLGPLKTVHFYDAVNITGGLDFLRVSPDHGPAADKFGQGVASSQSFSEALAHCLRYLGYGVSRS